MTTAAAALSGAAPEPAAAAAPAPAAPAPAPAAPAPAAPAASNENWYSGIQDAGARTWAEAKGWKDPLAAVESAYNLEKLVGFDKAGRTIVVPKEDATPEEKTAFARKLGAPEKADGYKLPDSMKDDPLAAKYRERAFKNGMPASHFEDAMNFLAEERKTATEAMTREKTQKGETEFNAFKQERGSAFDQDLELGKRFSRQIIPAKDDAERADILNKIEDAVGTKMLLTIMANGGRGLAEHKVHDGGGNGLLLTPAQAAQRIEELKSDKAWAKSYLDGDKGKQAEMQRLHALANPDAQIIA